MAQDVILNQRNRHASDLQAQKGTDTVEGGIWIHACKYTRSVVVCFVKQCEVEGFDPAN